MNSPIKKGSTLLLVMLLSVSGCGGKRKKCLQPCEPTKEACELAIPAAPATEEVKSAFDDDIAEFALVDEDTSDNKVAKNLKQTEENLQDEDLTNEFSWIDEEENRDESLKTVYFDFDKYAIRKDQEATVCQDIQVLKNKLADAEKKGLKATIIVEGHADSSAGSRAYNLALSEKRAKALAGRFAGSGIPRSQVKVVGRGQECPAMINGKAVTGTPEQQWPNRRDEINIINA